MSLLQTIRSLAPLLASAAQAEYDAWEVDAGGLDPEIGEGGICDRVADAIGTVLAQHGIDVTEGGQDGDDHAFLYAYNDAGAVEVNIPPGVYETGSGYSWKKRPGVTIGADDVMINPVRREDILGESYPDYRRRGIGMVSEALTPTQFMQMVEANYSMSNLNHYDARIFYEADRWVDVSRPDQCPSRRCADWGR